MRAETAPTPPERWIPRAAGARKQYGQRHIIATRGLGLPRG